MAYTAPTFVDVPNPAAPPVGAVPLNAANLNSLVAEVQRLSFGRPRRRDLPGLPSLLTAYTGTAPTLTTSAANAAVTIASPQYVGYTNAADPHLGVFGAKLAWAQDDASALTPSSVVPTDGNSFQTYRAGIVTDAPLIGFNVRGTGIPYRFWVDGHPLSLTASTLPGGGAFYWLYLDFGGVRATRAIEMEMDSGHLAAIAVGSGDLAMPAAKRGLRGVILGDSYAEGTGSTTRFTSWAQTFGQLCGWGETVVAGSGGTGYLATGSPTYTGRQAFRTRFDAVVTVHNPDVVVVAGGRNDTSGFTTSQVGTEAAALFAKAQSALPNAQLVVTSTFPISSSEVTSMQPYSDAIASAASAAGAVYLDVMGSNAYIGGTTNLLSGDGVHPNQAGHDALARALFRRYAAALPA